MAKERKVVPVAEQTTFTSPGTAVFIASVAGGVSALLGGMKSDASTLATGVSVASSTVISGLIQNKINDSIQEDHLSSNRI